MTTVTAIGTPTAPGWEIRLIDYVDTLRKLTELSPHPITTVITGQSGYSTILNDWIQSLALGVKVLDAVGDVRARPTEKFDSLGLTTRKEYETIQAVSGGNRARHGHLLSINIGRVDTYDDVLRNTSVRSGRFIASARNPVELGWMREHAALGVTPPALDLGRATKGAGTGRSWAGKRVTRTVVDFFGDKIISERPLTHEVDLATRGGWDHGAFRTGEYAVPYLNEYMAIDGPSGRVTTYPGTISVLRKDNGLPLAIKDTTEGCGVALAKVDVAKPPLSLSAVNRVTVGECEDIMDVEFLKYLPERQEIPDGGTCAQA